MVIGQAETAEDVMALALALPSFASHAQATLAPDQSEARAIFQQLINWIG